MNYPICDSPMSISRIFRIDSIRSWKRCGGEYSYFLIDVDEARVARLNLIVIPTLCFSSMPRCGKNVTPWAKLASEKAYSSSDLATTLARNTNSSAYGHRSILWTAIKRSYFSITHLTFSSTTTRKRQLEQRSCSMLPSPNPTIFLLLPLFEFSMITKRIKYPSTTWW